MNELQWDFGNVTQGLSVLGTLRPQENQIRGDGEYRISSKEWRIVAPPNDLLLALFPMLVGEIHEAIPIRFEEIVLPGSNVVTNMATV